MGVANQWDEHSTEDTGLWNRGGIMLDDFVARGFIVAMHPAADM